MMRAYEFMVILDGDLDELAAQDWVKSITESIAKVGGQVHGKPDWWGKRQFAYPIDKKEYGYYVVINLVAAPSALDEVERSFRIADDVVRHKLLRLPDAEAMRRGLGVAAHSTVLALILFFLVMPVFTFPFSPLKSYLSRRHEFEADAYAAEHAQASDLVHALVKLYQDNASTLTPDPLHSLFHDSHPPAAQRIAHGFAVDRLGALVDQRGKSGRVARIGKTHRDAHLWKGMGKQVIGSAVQRGC